MTAPIKPVLIGLLLASLVISCSQEVKDEPGIPLRDVSTEEKSSRNSLKSQVTLSIVMKVPLNEDGTEDVLKAVYREVDTETFGKDVGDIIKLYEGGFPLLQTSEIEWLTEFEPSEDTACDKFLHCKLRPKGVYQGLTWTFGSASYPKPGYTLNGTKESFHYYAWQRNWQ